VKQVLIYLAVLAAAIAFFAWMDMAPPKASLSYLPSQEILTPEYRPLPAPKVVNAHALAGKSQPVPVTTAQVGQ
jgi:hypothetical protein